MMSYLNDEVLTDHIHHMCRRVRFHDPTYILRYSAVVPLGASTIRSHFILSSRRRSVYASMPPNQQGGRNGAKRKGEQGSEGLCVKGAGKVTRKVRQRGQEAKTGSGGELRSLQGTTCTSSGRGGDSYRFNTNYVIIPIHILYTGGQS
eukprot:6184054-Pleurochrysis_carterae.AAC.2